MIDSQFSAAREFFSHEFFYGIQVNIWSSPITKSIGKLKA